MEPNGVSSGGVRSNAGSPPSTPATLGQMMGNPISGETLRQFFRLTGGSPLFCLSAVFVAYGIVKMLGPILAESAGLSQAMPCLLTLHAYEAAMLAALLLIVCRKVVDDALSLAILIGLFLVSTSIALGAVGNTGTGTAAMGLAGIVLCGIKLGLLRRYAKIPFGALTLAGLMILLAANYLGPLLLARMLDAKPEDTPGHRTLWFWVCFVFLVGAGAALIEAVHGRTEDDCKKQHSTPFLQQSAMTYLFVLVVLAASGVHLYTMAYSFALPRAMGDYVPLVAVGCLLLMEALRHAGKQSGVLDILLSGAPLAIMLIALHHKSVPATGQFGVQLIAYPPVLLALCGIAFAALGIVHLRPWLLAAVFTYGLGVILTVGYSPLEPYALNYLTCCLLLGVTVFLVGIFLFNPYICLTAAIGAFAAAGYWKGFPAAVQAWGLTQAGGLAGVLGVGVMAILLIFGRQLHGLLRFGGAVCLAIFVYDWLPGAVGWRYAAAVVLIALLAAAVWYRCRDTMVISVLMTPLLGRLYTAAKPLAYWRPVMVGFILLAGGTVVSLLKRKQEDTTENVSPATQNPNNTNNE